MRRTVVLLALLALALPACSTLTGRPFVTWTDDKAITARVKARLAKVDLSTVSRIHVDTYESVVYLSGSLDSADEKQRVESAARAVEGVRQVVSNVVVSGPAREGSAPSALPRAALSDAVPAPLAGVVARIEGSTAYDDRGRHVATVYTVPLEAMAYAEAERFAATRAIDHVTIHALPADSSTPTPHYLVVLWHVPAQTSRPRVPRRRRARRAARILRACVACDSRSP